MRFSGFIFAGLLVFASQAWSDDIPPSVDLGQTDLSGLAVGTAYVYQDGSDGKLTIVYEGAAEGGHRITMRGGAGRDGSTIRSYLVSQAGHVIRSARANGDASVYSPHDCSRAPEDCRFTVRLPSGRHFRGYRQVEKVGAAWRYEIFLQGDTGIQFQARTGKLEVDRHGMPIFAEWQDVQGDGKMTYRLIEVLSPD